MTRPDDMDDLLRDVEAGLRVSDTRFDKIFPVDARAHGGVHWTPVAVALEAAEWLAAEAETGKPFRVLDVGSNVGKFCVVGALATKAHFTGVERRRRLVDLARAVTRTMRIERVRYLARDMVDVDWAEFDGIYLFNPFQENIAHDIQIDKDVPLNTELYKRYVSVAEAKLAACRAGVRVATYYGFGGKFPEGFEKVEPIEPLSDRLELWVKRA